jgi:hypothetical protein
MPTSAVFSRRVCVAFQSGEPWGKAAEAPGGIGCTISLRGVPICATATDATSSAPVAIRRRVSLRRA